MVTNVESIKQELHKVINDERLAAFMTMEDFERKWNINQPKKESEVEETNENLKTDI